MQAFISCDWGTSVLRLRVVGVDETKVFAQTASEQGISGTFELWKQSGMQEDKKLFFYRSILNEQVINLENKLNFSLQNMPLIISGMASSNIGMLELPYKEIPFNADGHDLQIKIIEAVPEFMHKILMISGIKTNSDVMRGEETQLIGCLNDNDKTDQYFIFTGTHSKHVTVKNGKAVNFKTYMTGEFFSLLSKKSVLSNTVEENNLLSNDNLASFEKGVAESSSNLLHASFLVRTNYILGKFSRKENYYFLSGLLIGNEMKELTGEYEKIILVGNKSLNRFYEAAFNVLNKQSVILKVEDADDALLKGQFKIYSVYSSLLSN